LAAEDGVSLTDRMAPWGSSALFTHNDLCISAMMRCINAKKKFHFLLVELNYGTAFHRESNKKAYICTAVAIATLGIPGIEHTDVQVTVSFSLDSDCKVEGGGTSCPTQLWLTD
jgi:hypothetical protein